MSNYPELTFRKTEPGDRSVLEEIRAQAFAPIFASFRKILGDEIYEVAQKREDEQQSALLSAMYLPESRWDLYTVVAKDEIVGFVSILINTETGVGEIGLNAVRPRCAGRGIGKQMYEFACTKMKAAGLRVATVATGADESHTPARRAYEKSGFNVQIPSVWYCRTL